MVFRSLTLESVNLVVAFSFEDIKFSVVKFGFKALQLLLVLLKLLEGLVALLHGFDPFVQLLDLRFKH